MSCRSPYSRHSMPNSVAAGVWAAACSIRSSARCSAQYKREALRGGVAGLVESSCSDQPHRRTPQQTLACPPPEAARQRQRQAHQRQRQAHQRQRQAHQHQHQHQHQQRLPRAHRASWRRRRGARVSPRCLLRLESAPAARWASERPTSTGTTGRGGPFSSASLNHHLLGGGQRKKQAVEGVSCSKKCVGWCVMEARFALLFSAPPSFNINWAD